MTFQLLRLQPDPAALATWATRHELLSPDGDYGYAFHALLHAAFGELAPKPLRYLGGRQGLLAYTSADLDALRLHAQMAAPDVARALGLDELDARPFPTVWNTGQRLAFEVRVRPVVRAKDGRERDAFLHAIGEDSESAPTAEHDTLAERATIYTGWLAKQLSPDGAARIIEARMDAFRLTRVMRKTGANGTGKRHTRFVCGPDTVFKGQLEVGDVEAFAGLLARGVGRHRAFGFGMLLLRPASTC
ncbi:type I-E CRISPR-associated protein Cas6/Cse3/CasE [Aromatoleum bremense]|uniref:Type I-E CRISPR-associated protein Cas6/Cse3/CasE n=1 Tax=Aromatoleum bremense TaxID=76115 RepID=A0ABX1P0E8_9RHOO|nr:type I-E CRISPR-associated protein Cas6/Cse3/CasE [Aromatoleum bremense]NMG17377.1 type I-E CRISPR-associated protein Cas6/Cse3/CasE [Aromatoleum bremense]QTQ31966.1 CRISPR system cascade, subunit Cas6 [Aromatoleum bremense]